MKKIVSILLLLTIIVGNTNGQTKKFIDLANINNSVKPTENFYEYANGSWLKNNPIPATESRWGSFSEVQEFNYKVLREILDDAAKKPGSKGGAKQKVGDFYASGMDTVMIEKNGIKPLVPYLERIDKIKNKEELLVEVAKFHTEGIGVMFTFFATQDDKNSTKIVPKFYQGGVGMSDKDYYFKDEERYSKLRKAYTELIVKLFTLTYPNNGVMAKKAQEVVMKIETGLAKSMMTRVELRDPVKQYNLMTLDELQAKAPAIDWKILTKNLYSNTNTYIVGQPEFIATLGNLVKEESLENWKLYLKWHLIRGASSFLTKDFVKANFEFTKVQTGQKEMKPRWKTILGIVDGSVGEQLGKLYVEKYFKPEAKKRMTEMLNNLSTVYQKRIENLDWMSQETKTKALKKLSTFMRKIGYPDKWKDDSKLVINRKSYWDNIAVTSKYEYLEMMDKINKPVDRTEWGMTPPTVNAYYNPALNEIVFPAGILQFPFFDANADDAVNYGGIGAVIGHEMTHGFDDEGRQYDDAGNLADWWTESDGNKFKEKAGKVVEQYNAFTVLDTVHVNGELTLGENLADLGGISLALEAFKMTKQAKDNAKIDGFTPEQRFFLSWGQIWRANIRDQEAARRIVVDPHSPGIYRCNGPLTNMPEFYAAFGVKEGDKMWRPATERAKVW
jgi:putative endopeptidase